MTALPLPIPTVETDRLILRAPRASDLDTMADFYADDRSRFVGGPKTRHETWRSLIGMIGHWAIFGYGFWVIEDKATGHPFGGVGIINHEGWDEPELGWHLYAGAEGKGIGHEAALAARDHAARHFGIPAPISYIDPANTRSLALAKRLGATFERDGDVMGTPCHIFRHPAAGAA
ncbi:GNAT family N-acetyltransferase [Thalassovita taeanensis]|uniref:Protein N-acetyltransferase, RimJ/RimL family n=1 Tax=Thalassovita taeanensis TaxID=657014 RepID=A0A1H9DIL5_9RHOB|nr:GNAT family N-acetyltransferase [Thalassovita taeanensis]SEQ13352.1 Protein N-acetyltransferase, RimJ/RimL family [Thalassovita taeanensis]